MFFKCILLLTLLIPTGLCGGRTHYYGNQSQALASYPDPVRVPGGSNLGTNCSRFHEICKIDQPGLSGVHVVHFLDEPMIAAYGIDNKNEGINVWYTFNLSTNSYQLNDIETCVVQNAVLLFFVEIHRKEKYFGVAPVRNLHNMPIITNVTSTPPPNGDFLLGSEAPDKLSQAVIAFLDKSVVPSLFRYYQLLPANNVGMALAFKLVTITNSIQDCALFTISNKNIFEAKIFCFHPLDFQPDDEAVHEFQTIPINEFPLLTTSLVGKTTLVVIVDSDNHIQNMMKSTEVNRDVAKILTHAPGNGIFVNTQQIRVPHTVTIDTVLTAQDMVLLTLGSRPDRSFKSEGQSCTGLVSIYTYNKRAGKFEFNQSLHVKNLVQLRFLLVVKTREVLLFALSSDAVNNISIYSFKGAKNWEFLCSVTVPSASFLETVSFSYQGQFRAHVIAVTPSGATVVAV